MTSALARSALALAALLLAAVAPAQTGNLYGTALDALGNPVSGVRVTINGPGAVQTANTDAKGDFRFLNLSPGTYSVRLERTGFGTARQDVTVSLGNAILSVVMPVAGVVEAVTVDADAPLDNRKNQTGATFGQKELESIPTTRDPWAILRQVPGVLLPDMNVGGDRRSRQSSFVGKGSHADQNSYNLDGIPSSRGGISPLYYDFDTFNTIQVATGGSDPSLATPGVTLNLVTKRGTNELLGSARVLYTGGAGWDYGIGVGGPIWRDRLWLWGAAARDAFLGQTLFAAGEPVENQETLKHWNAKLSAQPVGANSLTVSYTDFDRVGLGLGADPQRSLPTTYTNTLQGQDVRVTDSHVLSANFIASFSLSSVNAAVANLPLGGPDEQADIDTGGIWRHSYSTWHARDTQHVAGLNTSSFFDTGRLRHELKFGFGYTHHRLDSASTWPGDQLVGNGYQAREAAVTRMQKVNSEVNAYDAFVGDTILVADLTVNVGVRFDYQQGKNLPSAVAANPAFPELLPAVQYGGDAGYPVTWREVQPRVGAAYAIGRDHRTLLRASYSRFTDQLGETARTVNAFPGIAELDYNWKDRNRNGRVEPNEIDPSVPPIRSFNVDPNDPGSSVQINRIARNLEPPKTDEFIVGVEQRISADLSGSLAYTHRIIRDIAFSPLIGTTRASYQYAGNATGTAVDPTTGFVLNFNEPYYDLTECPDPCVGTVLENQPDANQTFDGVELQLMKAFSHGWMARVSFGYNDWRQHIGSGGVINPNNEVPGTVASGPVVVGSVNATWQFNVSGMVELPLGIEAGVNLFGRQGFPTPYRVLVFTTDLRSSVPLIQIGPATRYRTPNVYELDLQLSKSLRIGSTVTVIPQLACFNLLNSRTVLARDGLVGTYDATATPAYEPAAEFNTVAAVLSGRVFRGGVRIAF